MIKLASNFNGLIIIYGLLLFIELYKYIHCMELSITIIWSIDAY